MQMKDKIEDPSPVIADHGMMAPYGLHRNLLVVPKDPTDKLDQAGVIYALQCGWGLSLWLCGKDWPPSKEKVN